MLFKLERKVVLLWLIDFNYTISSKQYKHTDLPYTTVELIVSNAGPEWGFLVRYRCHFVDVQRVHGIRGRSVVRRAVRGGRSAREPIAPIRWRRTRAARARCWTHARHRTSGPREVTARVIGHIVRHGRLGQLLERQQAVPRSELWVSRHKDRRQNGRLDPFIMVRIYTNFLLLRRERVLTKF